MGDDYNLEKTFNHKVIPLLLEFFKNTEKVGQIAPIRFSIGGLNKGLLGFTDGSKLISLDAILRPLQDVSLQLKSEMLNYPLQMIQLELILFTAGLGFLVFFEPLSLSIALVLADRHCHLFGGQGTLNVPCWSPDGQAFAFMRYAPEA